MKSLNRSQHFVRLNAAFRSDSDLVASIHGQSEWGADDGRPGIGQLQLAIVFRHTGALWLWDMVGREIVSNSRDDV